MLYNTKFHCSSTSPAWLVPKHPASWSLEQPDILLPVTIFLEINDLKVTFLYRAHEQLVPVVIHLVRIKVRVVQHLLYEILDKGGIQLRVLGKILHNSIACSEKIWRFAAHHWQKPSCIPITCDITNNITYYNIL